MRTELAVAIVLGAIAAAPRSASAQDSTGVPCHASACAVQFDWGNGNNPPDPDRRYGAPSDLESMFLARLQELGFSLARVGDAPTTITVRLTPLNHVICETMSGTSSDYSCHTVDRAAISVRSDAATAKQVPRVDVLARCSDPKMSISMPQFGRYAAEMFAYVAVGSKGERPRTKC